jgi:osmoprotectant transport system substrate-binding protein
MSRRSIHALLARVAAVSLVAAACGDDDSTATGGNAEPKQGPTIKIGVQDFGESAILGQIYVQALKDQGFNASVQKLGGFRDLLFGAFDKGAVNLAPEYVASELSFLDENAGKGATDVDAAFGKLKPLLDKKGLVGLTPSSAVDTNTFVVTKQTADDKGLSKLSDLADHTDLKLGAPTDCETNPYCLPALKRVYGVDLSQNFVPLKPDLVATSLEEGAIDIGVLFSTNGVIADKGWVILEDDKHMLQADNVFPVLSQSLVDAYGNDLTGVLDNISSQLNTADLTALNKRYDVDKEDADVIAAAWLKDHDVSGS